MFMRVCKVGDIVSTSPTLVSSLCPHLKGGLLGLGRVLLLLLTVLLSMLAVLSMLGLLLLLLLLKRRSIWLQYDAIHGTAQCALSSRRDGVDNLRWCNCMLLPGL